MKNLIKLIGVFILITLIALTITSCPEPVDSEGFMAGGGGGAPGGGTPGGGIDPHTHNWSNWTQTKAPTEEQDGSETRTCSNNPVHSETRPIAALNHTHNWGAWNVTTAATFIAAGEETKTCTLNASHKETRPLSQLEIKTTDNWETAKTQLDGKTGNYTLTINGSFGVEGSTTNTFGITNGSSVTLKGSGKINLISERYLLYIETGRTLVIDSASLTFEGLSTNTWTLIVVHGTLELKNGTISGNRSGYGGGGVSVYSGGTFIMTGGTITGNTANGDNGFFGSGGGVYVNRGTFTMNGGTISGNTANNGTNYSDGIGGGVYIEEGTFTMNGGTISGNTASIGGGVFIYGNVTFRFRMVNGTIYGSNESNATFRNTGTNAALSGGGEYGTFTGTTWNSNGSLTTTSNTIKVVNGVLQP